MLLCEHCFIDEYCVHVSVFFFKIQMKNKIVREVIDFVKGHQSLFDQILRLEIAEADELRMEQINLVVGILSKVLFSSVISLFFKIT